MVMICPCCGHLQTRLFFRDGESKTAGYRCEFCSCSFVILKEGTIPEEDDRYLHCTGCDHVFQAGEHTSKSKGVLCPYCWEVVTTPSARVEIGFGHSVADMHYCNGCGRLFHIRSYEYYPHLIGDIEDDWKRKPVQYIGGTYRCKREKITVDYAIIGLCSDGRYLTEAYYMKMDGMVLRRMLKMPMGEEGEPVFPRLSIRCPDELWRETRRGYQKQERIWCRSL